MWPPGENEFETPAREKGRREGTLAVLFLFARLIWNWG